MVAAAPGALMLLGAILILVSVGSIIAISWALRGLPEGRRALSIQMAAAGAYAISAGTRVGLMFAHGDLSVGAALVLGALDAFLAAMFWWSLRPLNRLLEGDERRKWRMWPFVSVSALTYVGFTTVFPTLRTEPMVAVAQSMGILIIMFWGFAMVQVYRLLHQVERPQFANFPLASVFALAVPIITRNVVDSWMNAETVAGQDVRLVEAAGVPVAGLLSLAATFTLFVTVYRADVAHAVTRRVLQAAAHARASPAHAHGAPRVARASELVDAALSHETGAASAAASTALKRCKVCGKSLEGGLYHSHEMDDRVRKLVSRDIVRMEDAERHARP